MVYDSGRQSCLEVAMTRKDYVLLASVIDDTYNNYACGEDERVIVKTFASRMCDRLTQDNARFDSVKFLNACGF